MNNNTFRLPPYGGRPLKRTSGKGRPGKDGAKKIIITLVILLLAAALITFTIIEVRNNRSDPTINGPEKKPSASTDSSSGSTSSPSKSNTSSTETREPAAVGGTYVEFKDADEEYARTHRYCVGVNRKQNVVTVYEKDENGKYTKPVRAFLCSCGKAGNETPDGAFKTSDKVRWLSLVDSTYGQYTTRVNGQIWFHSVPYFAKDPSQLETEEFNKLGQNASLGCIRLSVTDVKWLYDNLAWQTIVVVYDSDNPGPLGKPESLKIDIEDKNKGWDPTDPDEKNPWN